MVADAPEPVAEQTTRGGGASEIPGRRRTSLSHKFPPDEHEYRVKE
jgi:hypothetical protein